MSHTVEVKTDQFLYIECFKVEGQATDILQSKLGLKMELENLQKKAMDETPLVIKEDNSIEMEKVCSCKIN